VGKLADAEDRKAVKRLWQRYDIGHHIDPDIAPGARRMGRALRPRRHFKIKASNQMKNLLRYDIAELAIIPFGKPINTWDRSISRRRHRRVLIRWWGGKTKTDG
jgi:hypothetical protein